MRYVISVWKLPCGCCTGIVRFDVIPLIVVGMWQWCIHSCILYCCYWWKRRATGLSEGTCDCPKFGVGLGARYGAYGFDRGILVHNENHCRDRYRMHMSLQYYWDSHCILIVYYGEADETWIHVLQCIVDDVWTVLYLIFWLFMHH